MIFRLCVLLSFAPAVAYTQAQLPTFVEFRVPKAPTVAAGDSGAYLSYELHITNYTAAPLSLKRAEVRAGDQTLLALQDSALLGTLTRPGTPPAFPVAERPTIAGGSRANLYLWVKVDKAHPPASLTHRLTFARDTATLMLEGAVTAVDRSPVRIGAPLRGEWMAANAPSNESGHRRTQLVLNGALTVPQRFGIDFLQVDADNRTWSGDSTDNRSYYAYGEMIYAVGDGRVVATKDSIPENRPRSRPARAVPIDLVTVGGNHVVVDMGQGKFAFYAHVQPGSLRVRVGDRVKRGQVIGLVGNSGNSTEPHLHFHIVDGMVPGTSTLGAEGLPYALESFELLGRCTLGPSIQCARTAPIPVSEAMPLQNQLVRFRE